MAKRLPKTFRGVPLMRGKGYHHKIIDDLVEECAWAYDEWPDSGTEFYLVTWNNKDGSDLRDGKVFVRREDAVKYARSCGNGNCDQRVLRCKSELLVIATENEL